MNQKGTDVAIPRQVAFQICTEIRRENRRKWHTWGRWMCWGCETFTRGDLDKMCVGSRPDYRSCVQVNARYDRQPEGA
jgi:hypothetical protein